MSSVDDQYDASERDTLLGVARRSIEHGLVSGEPLQVDSDEYPPHLREPRATFVTLRSSDGGLRGCIGALEARRPLVCDVAHSAYQAAFRDPRFPPLTPDELPDIRVHLSILGPLEALPVTSEAELLQTVRPGVDGLLLRCGARQGTFLPSVWESLPDPCDFVDALKKKAQLPATWSPGWEWFRYSVESFD